MGQSISEFTLISNFALFVIDGSQTFLEIIFVITLESDLVVESENTFAMFASPVELSFILADGTNEYTLACEVPVLVEVSSVS